MKRLHIVLIVLIGVGLSAFAPEKSRKELRGDKYYTIYAFDKAIDFYSRTKNLSTDGLRKLAKSYHNLDLNIKAEVVYKRLITSTEGVIAEDYFNYAMILKSNGKYEEANKWLDEFRKLKPDDLRAKSYTINGPGLSTLIADNGKYSMIHLDVNTDAEDFAPSYFKDKIVFASTRERPKFISRKYNWNRKPFLDMYVSDIDKDQLKKPENFSNKLNGIKHDGPAAFNSDGTMIAFTRNDYETKRKDKIVQLQICFSTFKDGKWSDAEPFVLNSKDYSVGQPWLSANGNTMYFTSDMPGGYGGTDLYRITKDAKGTWGKAENLGDKINTEGDEMYPFLQETNGVLFFSSNGRFGLGGQDIFVTALNGSGFGPVINAGAPLNTSADDFATIVNAPMKSGYFTSNRPGGSGDDDIYSFEILKDLGIGKRITGIAKDKNGTPLPHTFITLLDNQGKMMDTVTTKDAGDYSFLVETDKSFKLTGTKEKYLEGDTVANTNGKEFIVKANVTLLQNENPVAEQYKVGEDLGKRLELKPIFTEPGKTKSAVKAETVYFDLDKYNIRPDAAAELDKIVVVMNENPEMEIELGSHTDCRASVEYNQILSDKRAKASVDYLRKRISKPERITGKGYGKTRLLNHCSCDDDLGRNCSEVDHQKNRRTEFILVKK